METAKQSSDNAIIEVKNLVKRYSGNKTNSVDNSVDTISFSVKRGEFFGFLGPNGAGKSTTMSMLVNLVSMTSGSVSIAGFDVEKKPDEVYKRVGFAMQEVGLDETATAREMLELHGRLYHLPKAKIESQIKRLLKVVDLEKVADRYTSTYSGGMRRRFDLALALIHEPEVLFLDEPTTGLDPHARQMIWQHLRTLNKEGMTIFLTTHAMEEAEALCDRLAIIDKGKIVTEGTVEELKKKHDATNLEAVFLKVTGHNLAEDEGNANAVDPYARALR
jgi:ABC-2 type transport system ATP-binding protein